MSKATSLSPSQINRVLDTCKLLPHWQAKRCSLVLSHSAMRVTEIALLETKHILHPSGLIREELALPARICKRLKRFTKAIIQDWIDYRKAMGGVYQILRTIRG